MDSAAGSLVEHSNFGSQQQHAGGEYVGFIVKSKTLWFWESFSSQGVRGSLGLDGRASPMIELYGNLDSEIFVRIAFCPDIVGSPYVHGKVIDHTS